MATVALAERPQEPESQTARLGELTSGLSLEYVRIRGLKSIAQAVYAGLAEHGVWFKNSAGEPVVRTEAIRVYRDLLADIAAEMGQRVRRVEIVDERRIRELSEQAGVNPDLVLKRVRDASK